MKRLVLFVALSLLQQLNLVLCRKRSRNPLEDEAEELREWFPESFVHPKIFHSTEKGYGAIHTKVDIKTHSPISQYPPEAAIGRDLCFLNEEEMVNILE